MFRHVKQLQYTVRVAEPNPGLANLLLEQFGGPQGELAAACRYFTQGLSDDDPGRKDMLMDIATEGRGSFKKVKDSMVTGVTDADEPHAIAVIGAKYDKKSVVFRIAFDTEMNLIGLDVRGK